VAKKNLQVFFKEITSLRSFDVFEHVEYFIAHIQPLTLNLGFSVIPPFHGKAEKNDSLVLPLFSASFSL